MLGAMLGTLTGLVFIIGRLWTASYFGQLGLETSGLDFSVYEYAFRSLVLLFAIVLGAGGLASSILFGPKAAALLVKLVGLGRPVGLRLAVAGTTSVFLLVQPFLILPIMTFLLPDRLLASVGVMGLIVGVMLTLAAWFVRVIWQALPIHSGGGTGWLGRIFPPGPLPGYTVTIAFIAFALFYFSALTPDLARLSARSHVENGRFSAAILEAKNALPVGIASPYDPTISVPVRVILSQEHNTYLLDSTTCTTIGDASAGQGVVQLEVNNTLYIGEICTVYAIPTPDIAAISYFPSSRTAPPNESVLRPVKVDLEKRSELAFTSVGASDEPTLSCDQENPPRQGTDVAFARTLWYEFTPAEDGAVLASVRSRDFRPIVGVWSVPTGLAFLQNVSGSGPNKVACYAFGTDEDWLNRPGFDGDSDC